MLHSDGTAGKVKDGYLVHSSFEDVAGMKEPTMEIAGSTMQAPMWGIALCPQPTDVCDTTSKMASKKTKTFAKAGESTTVTIKGTSGLTGDVACSYLVEATCDSPYVKLEGAGSSWDSTNQDKLTYSVIEYSDKTIPSANRIPEAKALTMTPAAGGPAVADFLMADKLDIMKIPKPWGEGTLEVATPINPYVLPMNGGFKAQGLMKNGKDPMVVYSQYEGDNGEPVNPFFLLRAIAAKKAEFKAFAA